MGMLGAASLPFPDQRQGGGYRYFPGFLLTKDTFCVWEFDCGFWERLSFGFWLTIAL